MAPVTQPVALKRPNDPASGSDDRPGLKAGSRPPSAPSPSTHSSDDGTNQLLKWGGLTLGTGLLFALLTRTVLGGIGPQGPHTNSGWMALIVTMMCLPFGFLLFLLGALKWLRNRRERLNSISLRM